MYPTKEIMSFRYLYLKWKREA